MRDPARHHRLAPLRRPRDLGHVEIPVDRLRERARDGCGSHVEHMGSRCAKGSALLDAEAVLLVHDCNGEVWELDSFLDERMCPDDEVGPLELAFDRTREERSPHAQLGADRLQGEEVLLGERLRWRHERSLVPALDRAEDRVESHDRLARAHVSL